MSKINDGGPAFPAGERFEGVDGWRTEPGMTLRDYFAAKAMQGLMSREGKPDVEHETALAYRIADAMLKAREGGAA